MLQIELLPWPKVGAGWVDHTLSKTLYIEQWEIPEGTIVKLQQTRDFGWIALPKGTKDRQGFVIPRRLFRF